MRVLMRMAVCAIVAIVTTAIFLTAVHLLGGPSVFNAETARAIGDLIEERIKSDALSHRDQIMNRCLESKSEIIHALAADRITLEQAIHQFREVGTLLDDGQDDVLGPNHGQGSSDEDLCENLAHWITSTLRENPTVVERLLKRIEKGL